MDNIDETETATNAIVAESNIDKSKSEEFSSSSFIDSTFKIYYKYL